jgi:ectoine hydroxylase-related dioxygenase (phytanoyl-CoA dioxygenase family)
MGSSRLSYSRARRPPLKLTPPRRPSLEYLTLQQDAQLRPPLIPLPPSCIHAGNLWVVPGSHIPERAARLSNSPPPGALHSNAWRRGGLRDPAFGLPTPDAAAVPIETHIAGAAIVFDKDLVHAGGPNLSGHIRYALYFRLRWQQRLRGRVGEQSMPL